MAPNPVGNILQLKELRNKLLWTFLFLCCFRLGVHVPVPGLDAAVLSEFMASMSGSWLALMDMFAGGGLSRISVFALGIMPYISSSIILQLLQVIVPDLKRMAKEEGQAGRRKITQYTRYLTILISVVQSFAIIGMLNGMTGSDGASVVLHPGWNFTVMTIVTLVTGTIVIMWLGEQITAKGIGNGISLIIFSGIVTGLPSAIMRAAQLVMAGDMNIIFAIILVVLMIAVIVGIVFVERAQRRIPIHYAKRQVGRKVYGGQTTHLPLRINTAGVIPPIFAQSLLMFPATLAGFSTAAWVQRLVAMFQPTSIVYNVIFIALIFFFCYFYTAIIFDPKDIAENLKKAGGFIPGIRPGDKTREYIDTVLGRLTFWGAIYISIIAVLPMFMIAQFNVPFNFGGTSLLIMVGVSIDFMGQVESHLISRQYEGLMGKTRIRGRV